jgi:2-methylfumaryl-CoA isomerase
MVSEDRRCSAANAMWEIADHPGAGTYLMPGTPLDFSAFERVPVRRAPLLGEHAEAVLSGLLGMTATEIGRLDRDGVIRCTASVPSAGAVSG